MRISFVAAAAASAALVSASPLRVIVVSNANALADAPGSNAPSFAPNMRFGHAVPALNPDVAQVVRLPGGGNQEFPPMFRKRPTAGRMPCGSGGMRGGRFRQKAIEVQNAFRKAFGLPLVETDTMAIGIGKGAPPPGGVLHILPFIGSPPMEDTPLYRPLEWHHGPPPPPPPHHGHGGPPPPFPPPPRHGGHHGHHKTMFHVYEGESFPVRLQNALMSLGPWEGRAVAFVVGAGIGVLIRMIWVFGIIAYRGFTNNNSSEYTAIGGDDFDDSEDEEEVGRRRTPISAPPQYVYPVDEKAAKKEEEEEAVVKVVAKADVDGTGN